MMMECRGTKGYLTSRLMHFWNLKDVPLLLRRRRTPDPKEGWMGSKGSVTEADAFEDTKLDGLSGSLEVWESSYSSARMPEDPISSKGILDKIRRRFWL
jgi:hypothetical protein